MSTKSDLPLFVLCGGEATRLKDINLTNTPKILLKKNNIYFLKYLLLNIKKKNIDNIYFLCDHRVYEIQKIGLELAEKYDLNCFFVEDGPIRLGTGGAIKNLCNKEQIGKFHLTFGDSLTIFDPNSYHNFVNDKKNKHVMTIYHNEKSIDQKNIKIKNDKIVAYEKNSKDKDFLYIDYGFMTFHSDIFINIKKDSYDLSLVIQLLIKKHLLLPFYCDKRFYEIGTPKSYFEFTNISDLKLKQTGYI